LGKDEPEGAGLQLASDKRRAEEDADEGGHDEQRRHKRRLQVLVDRRDLARLDAVDVDEVRTGDRQDHRDDDKCPDAGDRFGAELAPRKADHRAAPTSVGVRAPLPPARLM
jgi:hypothetical protein